MSTLIKLDKSDNVATAKAFIKKGENGALENIPYGHKMSIKNIEKSKPVVKYSQVIGYALQDIKKGEHIHSHNLEFSNLLKDYNFSTNLKYQSKIFKKDFFRGFKRIDGSVGTRNTIAILTSVNCSATAARKIADYFDDEKLVSFENIDNVTAYVHGTGCGMVSSGEGFEILQRVMWGYAKNPNVGGVLIVGLGCELNQIDWLLDAYGLKRGNYLQTLNIQEVAGLNQTIEKGIKKVKSMLPEVNKFKRTECDVSNINLALQCGGSDSLSGITANPALGYACDKIVKQGGTVVLAETPEIYGAEHLLTERAINKKIGLKLLNFIEWWKEYTKKNNGSMDNNPTPGNKKGGLTNILEKSLGAIAKSGTSPLVDVYKYAERINKKGFIFMDTPGYDPVSVTGQIAGGCNMVAFTTGRGSAFGSKPSPCIKISTNSEMYLRMKDDMDIDAGSIISQNKTVNYVGDLIYNKIISIASGNQSKSEIQGLGDYEFVPWQLGAVM